jgi:hypothetical protein
MIDAKHITRQLELSFWSFFIPLLSSSQTLHRLLPALYNFSRKEYLTPRLRRIFILSVSGFVIGIVLGFSVS